ncbi:MAG: hypothetical protein KGN35_12670 [Betaproteobacteria bacterium]|nr:hypothetical protein [Betaproteobacteria bacterium]
MRTIHVTSAFYAAAAAFALSSAVMAQDVSEIQRQFNAETAGKPFSVPDDATLTRALKEATERGTPTKTPNYMPGCYGLGCVLGQNYGYGSYFGGYSRPYYGGLYGVNRYTPYYSGW